MSTSTQAPKTSFPKGWKVSPDGKRVSVSFTTKDFQAALDIVNKVGAIAEEIEHHPDLHVEKWNHVRIETYSHDVGHLTQRDERLAARIDALLRQKGVRAS